MTPPDTNSPHSSPSPAAALSANAPHADAPHLGPADDERERAQYHAISGLALAALALGVLSVAAIFGPILWFIPVLAAVCALVAMRRITLSQGELTGWHVALLALLLAVFFGVAGPAHTVTRRVWIDKRAAEFADGFLRLLQNGDVDIAYQLTRPPATRKTAAAGAAPHGNEAEQRDPREPDPYQEFLTKEPTPTLLREKTNAKLERLLVDTVGDDDRGEYLRATYRMTYPDGGGTKSLEFRLVVQRSIAYGSLAEQWQILWPPTILTE